MDDSPTNFTNQPIISINLMNQSKHLAPIN